MTAPIIMSGTPRYAIYYAPAPEHPLHGFGSHVLGYDAVAGEELPFPAELTSRTEDWQELTQDPRKYGFHATLKAPFVLPPDETEASLRAACAEFAAMARRIPIIEPVIDSIEGFIAIVPGSRSVELAMLARDCVADFDHFRAPLTEHDRQRRNPSALTPRQRDYLERWGYPYVMDEFRFHMTLTGRLPEQRRDTVLELLRERFAALELSTLSIDRIALFRQSDPASRFRIVDHYPLRQAVTPEPAI